MFERCGKKVSHPTEVKQKEEKTQHYCYSIDITHTLVVMCKVITLLLELISLCLYCTPYFSKLIKLKHIKLLEIHFKLAGLGIREVHN